MPGGRPKGSRNKPKTEELLIDTAEDTLEDIPAEPKKPRQRQPGPKKVIDETGKAIANEGAKVLVKISAGNDGKGLLYEEAQSITTPAIRIIARRLPKFIKEWGKKFAPKVQVDPQDLADLQEIGLTFAKYALRILALMFQEAVTKKETGSQAGQQKLVVNNAPPAPVPQNSIIATVPLDDLSNDAGQLRVGVSSAAHNPMFNALGYDRGMAGE